MLTVNALKGHSLTIGNATLVGTFVVASVVGGNAPVFAEHRFWFRVTFSACPLLRKNVLTQNSCSQNSRAQNQCRKNHR